MDLSFMAAQVRFSFLFIFLLLLLLSDLKVFVCLWPTFLMISWAWPVHKLMGRFDFVCLVRLFIPNKKAAD